MVYPQFLSGNNTCISAKTTLQQKMRLILEHCYLVQCYLAGERDGRYCAQSTARNPHFHHFCLTQRMIHEALSQSQRIATVFYMDRGNNESQTTIKLQINCILWECTYENYLL